MAVNYQENSIFCTPEITLLSYYFRKASEDCSIQSFRDIDKKTSVYIIENYIAKVISQIVHDCSGEGHWEDEKDLIVLKLHYWCFLDWMNTVLGAGLNVSERSVEMNTTFYVELVKLLKFEKFMLQCLYQVDQEVMKLLTQEVMVHISDDNDKDNERLVLKIVELFLDKFCSDPITIEKSQILLRIISDEICDQQLWLKIIEIIIEKMTQFFVKFQLQQKKNSKYAELEEGNARYFGHNYNVFTKKQNFVEFEENIKCFLKDEILAKENYDQSNITQKTVFSNSELGVKKVNGVKLENEKSGEFVIDVLVYLTCFIYEFLTCKWKAMFSWVYQENGSLVIESSKKSEYHTLLVDIFGVSVLLQSYVKYKEEEDVQKLQDLVDILDLYFENQATQQEKAAIKEMLESQEINITQISDHQDEEYTLDEKLGEAIFKIQESLFENEKSFQWLLLTEELYHDERWLKCVMNYGKNYVSISTAKMLLDILCVLYESVLQDTEQGKIYNSLQQVVLDTFSSLSFVEQVEVIVYNFELTCVHFNSYIDQSLFILPNDHSNLDQATEKLTIVMNKVVNKSGQNFPPEVLAGVSNAALISPYIMLNTLLNKAVKDAGCEKIICELLQMFPRIVRLKFSENDQILIKVLKDILLNLSSKKQEGQYLKLIAALLQLIIHPDLETTEPALLSSSDVMKYLILPLLTNEDNHISPTLLLNIFMTILDHSHTSERHWILDQNPFEILFILFEMFQDCVHFWEDWISEESEDGAMERDDFALDEAWCEMNVIVKILEEHLIPLLTEDILQRPSIYMNQNTWIETQLNNLDWTISLLVLPLIHQNVIKCTIRLPRSLLELVMVPDLDVLALDDTDNLVSFWMVYFKSCALSNEILETCIAKLRNGYPEKDENSNARNQEIIDVLAKMLPFSTWSQWQRLLNIAKELFQFKYINLDVENSILYEVDLPNVDSAASSNYVINISGLLVSVLGCISNKTWSTPYVLSTTIKNYVSEIKQLIDEAHGNYKVYCHLLTHLCYIAFNIVSENFQENIIIVILDVLNTYLSTLTDNVENVNLDHIKYLESLLALVPEGQARLTMLNKIQRIFPDITK